MEKNLSQQTKEEAERVSLVQSALDHYIKALQHTTTSSVEQEFHITVADLQQRIHIFRAITLLGDFATGANFRKATPSDIKAAETDLSVCDRLILQGFKETKYRKDLSPFFFVGSPFVSMVATATSTTTTTDTRRKIFRGL